MRKGILRAPQRALESTIAPRSRRGKRHVGFWLSAKRITRPYLRISLPRNTDFCRWRRFVSAESSLETNRFFFGRYIDGFHDNWGLRNGAETKLNLLESNGQRVCTGQTRYFPETISVEPLARNAARVHVLLRIATCSLRQLLLRTPRYGPACTPSYLNSNRAGGWAALRWLVEQFLLESYLVVLGILSGQLKTSVSLIACTVVMANLFHLILSQRLQFLTMFFLSFISIRVSDFLRLTTSNNSLDYVLIERNRQR